MKWDSAKRSRNSKVSEIHERAGMKWYALEARWKMCYGKDEIMKEMKKCFVRSVERN